MTKYLLLLLTIFFSVDAFGQHDPGRDSVRYLCEGDMDAARASLENEFSGSHSPINDAEKHFVLAMISCREGNIAVAAKHAKQAVELGLPIERIQAGPRKIFAPLYEQNEFMEWLQTKKKPLLHGPLLGSITVSKAAFWFRTAEETKVQVRINPAQEKDFDTARFTAASRTSSNLDYTTTIEVTGLEPDTQYKYKVFINGRKIGENAFFKTFPQQGSAIAFSIAFGGGAGFTPKHERMWTTIKKHDLSALLMLGDNVYIDDPKQAVTQRYCYYRRQSQPEWKSLIESTPVFTIYDDHDFGTNDCVPGPDIEKPEWKRKVWQIFKQNWNNPAYGGGSEQPGCWYSFYIGNVHFIMLDCRYYRDLEGGSMIGPVQKRWLFETLKSSNGTFKVLASSVPWSPGVKPGSKDTWDGFKDEREEIFSFIEKNNIDGVLLMAADRHRSDMRKIPRSNGYDFYEVMSSRLTNVHTHGLVKNAKGSEFIMGYNKKCSFGLLEFDTKLENPQVTYKIINIDSEKIDSRSLKLSELSN